MTRARDWSRTIACLRFLHRLARFFRCRLLIFKVSPFFKGQHRNSASHNLVATAIQKPGSISNCLTGTIRPISLTFPGTGIGQGSGQPTANCAISQLLPARVANAFAARAAASIAAPLPHPKPIPVSFPRPTRRLQRGWIAIRELMYLQFFGFQPDHLPRAARGSSRHQKPSFLSQAHLCHSPVGRFA